MRANKHLDRAVQCYSCDCALFLAGPLELYREPRQLTLGAPWAEPPGDQGEPSKPPRLSRADSAILEAQDRMLHRKNARIVVEGERPPFETRQRPEKICRTVRNRLALSVVRHRIPNWGKHVPGADQPAVVEQSLPVAQAQLATVAIRSNQPGEQFVG